MAAAATGAVVDPPLSVSLLFLSPPLPSLPPRPRQRLALPQKRRIRVNPLVVAKPKLVSNSRSPRSHSCSCSSGTIDPVPAEEGPGSTFPKASTSIAGVGGTRDRRRAVRIAWEKLVRWSRSWRSKAKTDVLEKTRKVGVILL